MSVSYQRYEGKYLLRRVSRTSSRSLNPYIKLSVESKHTVYGTYRMLTWLINKTLEVDIPPVLDLPLSSTDGLYFISLIYSCSNEVLH